MTTVASAAKRIITRDDVRRAVLDVFEGGEDMSVVDVGWRIEVNYGMLPLSFVALSAFVEALGDDKLARVEVSTGQADTRLGYRDGDMATIVRIERMPEVN